VVFLVKKGSMDVNQRIKELRRYLKLSQKSFSRGIYISYGYIAEIELGNSRANDRIIELISTKYGVNRRWLETGEGNMFDKAPPDSELEQMTTIFKELNADYRALVLNIIAQLLKLQKKPDIEAQTTKDGTAD
jgi:transcriptional regulator with XRE-family HTH domain